MSENAIDLEANGGARKAEAAGTPILSKEIILASGSQGRRAMLAEMGLRFAVLPMDVDETASGAPEERVAILAKRKALAAVAVVKQGIVIGADTLVSLDGEALGKPEDDSHAKRMLRALSGRKHTVYTGVAMIDAQTGAMESAVDGTDVYMRDLTDEEIDAYVASGEPLGKAGSFSIQGLGGALVDHYIGSYANIVGFPNELAAEMLKRLGYVPNREE